MSSGFDRSNKSGVEAGIDFMEDTVSLLFKRMNLMSGVRQVGVARGCALDQQVSRLTDQLYLLLKILEELLVTWKQLHAWIIIFSYR